jgi:hypothetical protein
MKLLLEISIRNGRVRLGSGSTEVMWNSRPRPLRVLVRKPANRAAVPSASGISTCVISPMATARISIETLRGWPSS